MMETLFMFIFGAVFGSFACCQAWRIHEKPAKLGNRSVCMNCKNKLAWYDNIPIISWLILRGKCRKCKAKIGVAEILAEVGLGLVFLALSIQVGFNFNLLILGLSFVIFWILLIFDAKWGELPVFLMILEIPLAILYQVMNGGDVLQILMSVGILAGVYYLLYFLSKEKWVGGGDWILCISIAIFLGTPFLAVIELFLANMLASVYAIPAAIIKKDRHIPFGPFLILGLVVIILMKDFILRFFYFI